MFDSMVGPIFDWLKPFRRVQRFWIAPLSSNAAVRESYFRGEKIVMGELLAHRCSTLCIGLFAVSLLPMGVMVTCIAFFLSYWTCKVVI